MKRNFLLNTNLAVKLYNKVVKSLPIIDYHNHLNVNDLVNNISYENITKLWVSSDPYKHRAMRILGVKEYFITGNASDFEKFNAWYESLPKLVGNPLFDWSQMELEKVFDYRLLPLVDVETAWNTLNAKLKDLSVNKILDKFNIEYSAPCCSINDDVSVFANRKDLAPSLRGDDFISPSIEFIEKLSSVSLVKINSLNDYLLAIDLRLQEFKKVGAVFSDHALDNGFTYIKNDGLNANRFEKILNGETLNNEDLVKLKSFILYSVACLYSKYNITMQLHIGAERYTSSNLRSVAGPAGGFAGIGNTVNVKSLTEFLDDVDLFKYNLPKTILFTLNPSDNAVMATLSGSYSSDKYSAVVTQGPAWWWCDHSEGIYEMLKNFNSHSVLSTFIGMTTDSRSPLSFVRHDYYRRIICNFVANMVKEGRIPNNFNLIEDLLTKLCYNNAKELIGD